MLASVAISCPGNKGDYLPETTRASFGPTVRQLPMFKQCAKTQTKKKKKKHNLNIFW